jgi:glycosyltransferase involved in cell wall biosynthesis
MAIGVPRVSVVITSYNQKRYLIEAIESVIGQTVRPHEIILADDCSTDGSVEMIQHYVEEHPNWIKGVFQTENVGIPRNRTAGLDQATGDYVAILDGDDRYLPRNLEEQLKALAPYPETRCVYSNLYFIDAQGVRTRIRDTTPRPAGDVFTYLAGGTLGVLRSMLAPTDLVRRAGFLDERFPKHDGNILALRLAKYAPYAYVFEPLAEKRQHERSDSGTFPLAERLHYLEDVHREVQSLAGGLPSRDMRIVQAEWSWRLRRFRILSQIEEGRRSRALLHIVWAFFRHPQQVRGLPHLLRQALSEPQGALWWRT